MPKIIKKCILKRQLAYAIMAVAKKEIIKSKQHTPFLLPDWGRQRSYYIIYSNFLGRRRIKYKFIFGFIDFYKSLRKESKVVQTKKQYGDFSLTALSFASISIFSG